MKYGSLRFVLTALVVFATYVVSQFGNGVIGG